MVGMPELLSKGEILEKLDARYKDPGLDTLKARLKALQDLPPYPKGNIATFGETGAQRSGALTPADAQHIRTHWFNDPKGDGSNDPNGPGWWRGDLQPVEPIIRHGLITAIEVAIREPGAAVDRDPPLPIVFYWMCHAGHPHHPLPSPEDAVEVAVTWSNFQVTVVIHTPDPGTDDPLTGREPVYVVKRIKPDVPRGAHEQDLFDEPDSKGNVKNRIIRRRP